MKNINPIKLKSTLVLAGIIATLSCTANVHAVLIMDPDVPTGNLFAGSVTNTVQAGTQIDSLTGVYTSAGGVPVFEGTMDSRVVRRNLASTIEGESFIAGGLDFYYKVTLTNAVNNPDIEEWNTSPLAIGNTGTVESSRWSLRYLQPGVNVDLLLIPNFTGPSNPLSARVPVTYDFDGGVLALDHTAIGFGDTRLTALNPAEVWIILHTNSTVYGVNEVGVQDGGVARTHAFAPVPEPSSAIFGIAMVGLIGLARRRATQHV